MKDTKWLKENLIAHRGLHSKDKSVPENSKLAFEKAISYDFSIECDLTILKDGTIIVFHDKDFKRLCDVDQFLKDSNYEDISNYKLLNTDEYIMRFEDLLKFVNGKVPLLIEIKPFGNYKLLCDKVANILDHYPHPFAVFSFHPGVVYWFKKHRPTFIRGQITEYFESDSKMKPYMKYLMKTMFFNHFTKPDFVSYGIHDLPNKWADQAKKKGITMISYAARNQQEFDFVKSRYDNVVFEYFIPKEKSDS